MFVYCLIYQDGQFVKVGVTNSRPLWRLRVIQRKSGNKVLMNFFFPVKNRRIEKKILNNLNDFRIGNTEWFQGRHLPLIITEMKKFFNPNLKYSRQSFDVISKTQILEDCFFNKSSASIDGMTKYLQEIFE